MKKHRKIQKKQETELHVQVAEKPENQKENVGEALAKRRPWYERNAESDF